jgi:predicted unusual protein kinase regulating ubiquinone biosynthesis (AarF/ABC1/UbiB family)
VLLPSADRVILERAVSELFERFGGVAVGELIQTDPRELKEFALRFSELIRTLPFQLPNDFLFLIRALSLISGVTSALNRNFNMWDALDPFARSLLNGAGASTLRRLGADLLKFATTISRLPQTLDNLATRVNRGELVVRNPELETRMRVLDSSVRRLTAGLIFASLLGSGLVVNGQDQTLSYWLIGGSVLPLLYALGIGRISK